MITINAFTAADTILIPCSASYLPIKGLQELIKTIGKVRRQLNPKLSIEGILMTMVDKRTNYAKEIVKLVKDTYSQDIRIYDEVIPRSVRQEESAVDGKSIYTYAKNSPVAKSYEAIAKELVKGMIV